MVGCLEDKFDFYRKVNQTAFELGQRHGWTAHGYAAKLAAEARAEGDEEDHRFWSAVEAALTPRSVSA
jgi:hypothetical protein